MSTASHPASARKEGRACFRFIASAMGLVAGLWLIFAGVNWALPYVQPGAEVVYSAKTKVIRRDPLFRRDAPLKVVIFGNSQVLTCFQPELFDTLSGGSVSSYNLGLPDYLRFIDHLEELCQRGERPTHVLLMFPWQDDPEKHWNLFRPGINDKYWMDSLFPFRKLPRNLVLFTLRSRSRGGIRAYYEECRRQTETMLAQKGYFFIEGQSHFPGHRLPDNFRLQKDDPNQPFVRSAPIDGLAFQRMVALAKRYDIKFILIPRYFREGEVAPPEPQSALAAKLVPYSNISVQGPDCWLLPNRYFSDPTHLNREGAEFYTRRLWELVGPTLRSPTETATNRGLDSSASR